MKVLKPGEQHAMSNSKGSKIDYLLQGKEDKFLMEKLLETKNSEMPSAIEKQYVYDVYNKIAPHFSETRYKPWPQVVKFLDSLEDQSLVADVGCGNGKYLRCDGDGRLNMVGTDIAENLLKICKSKEGEVFTADSLKLPMKKASVDHAISIAVLHHFSNDLQRKRAIKELIRIVKPGGRVLVTVWAYEQDKKFPKQDLFVPWNLQDNFHKKNLEEGIEDEGLIKDVKPVEDEMVEKYKDEDKNAVVYKRYYHLFVDGELKKLLNDVPEAEMIDYFYNRDNWCIVLRKNN